MIKMIIGIIPLNEEIFSPSLFLSQSPSFDLCRYFFLSLSVYISPYLPLSIFVDSFSCLSLCISLPIFLSISITLSPSTYLSLPLSISLSFSPSLPPSLSHSHIPYYFTLSLLIPHANRLDMHSWLYSSKH